MTTRKEDMKKKDAVTRPPEGERAWELAIGRWVETGGHGMSFAALLKCSLLTDMAGMNEKDAAALLRKEMEECPSGKFKPWPCAIAQAIVFGPADIRYGDWAEINGTPHTLVVGVKLNHKNFQDATPAGVFDPVEKHGKYGRQRDEKWKEDFAKWWKGHHANNKEVKKQ